MKWSINISASPTRFTCPAGAMPMEYDKYGTDYDGINYKIEAVQPDNTTSNVAPTVLKPSGGQGLCKHGPQNFMITLVPGARQSDMYISLRVKGASSVTSMYKYGSTTSSPHTVSDFITRKEERRVILMRGRSSEGTIRGV